MNIAIVSHPRSGSSYLTRVFAQFSNVQTVMEPFHPNDEVAIQHIKHCLADNFSRFENDIKLAGYAIGTYAHEQPVKFLTLLKQYVNKPTLVFKLFPEHIQKTQFHALFNVVDGVIFLRRNQVHSFISSQIANETNVWANKNTSDIFPHFQEDAFLWWNKFIVSYFADVNNVVYSHGIPFTSIDYERINVENSTVELLSEWSKNNNLNVGAYTASKINLLQQDKRHLATEKVNNPHDLQACLHKYGIFHLNSAFEPNGKVALLKPTFMSRVSGLFSRGL